MMNGFDRLSKNARKSIEMAYSIATELKSESLDPEHLFMGILEVKEGMASKILRNAGFSSIGSKNINTSGSFESLRKKSDQIVVSDLLKKVIQHAYTVAREYGHVYVGTEHLLLGLLKVEEDDFLMELKKSGITYEGIRSMIANYVHYPMGLMTKMSPTKERSNSILQVLGVCLTDLARNGVLDPIVGREKEIDRLMHILSRRTKNNPILLGEAGVGKTAIVEGFAQRIVKGEVPSDLRNTEVWSIDIAHLLVGSDMRGDLEGKIIALIEEVSSNPELVIFIDEIHTILSSTGTADISNVLKPALAKGKLRCIGATTYTEYQRYFENDPALVRRFQPIHVDEVNVQDAIEILMHLKPLMEDFHKVKISNGAVEQAVLLSDRYISDRFLPDKAIDVLDEAAARKKMIKQALSPNIKEVLNELEEVQKKKEEAVNTNNMAAAVILRARENILTATIRDLENESNKVNHKKKDTVDESSIIESISNWTGIPIYTLSTIDTQGITGLPTYLSNQIIGQDIPVSAVSNAMKRVKIGITDEKRPLASFLFLGPTGVGKTELAKELARYLFHDEKAIIQIDMSEFIEGHSISKFIGSPPGYVGYSEGGHLTEKVRKKPYSVILFDEIEKAHPEVLNGLLQILEEGHLTDGKGRQVNFKNTIIVMTSNIGAEDIGRDKILGFHPTVLQEDIDEEDQYKAYDEMKQRMMMELKEYLRPEFINRIDDIVIFRSLDMQDAKSIAMKFIKELQGRLGAKGISLEVNPRVAELIAEKGFNEEFGARNIKRTVQEMLEMPSADFIINAKNIKSRKGINISVKPNRTGELVFK